MPNLVEIIIRGVNELGSALEQAREQAEEAGADIPIRGVVDIAPALEQAREQAAEEGGIEVPIHAVVDSTTSTSGGGGGGGGSSTITDDLREQIQEEISAYGSVGAVEIPIEGVAEGAAVTIPIRGDVDMEPAIQRAHDMVAESGPAIIPIRGRVEGVEDIAEHITEVVGEVALPVRALTGLGAAIEAAAIAAAESAGIAIPIEGHVDIAGALQQAHDMAAEDPIDLPILGQVEIAPALEEAQAVADEHGPLVLPITGDVQLAAALEQATAEAAEAGAEAGAAYAAAMGAAVEQAAPTAAAAFERALAEVDAALESLGASSAERFSATMDEIEAEGAVGGAETGAAFSAGVARTINVDAIQALSRSFEEFSANVRRNATVPPGFWDVEIEEAGAAGRSTAASWVHGYAEGLGEEGIGSLTSEQFDAMIMALRAEATVGGGEIAAAYANAFARTLTESQVAAMPRAQFEAMVESLTAEAGVGGAEVGEAFTASLKASMAVEQLPAFQAWQANFQQVGRAASGAGDAAEGAAAGLADAGAAAEGAAAGASRGGASFGMLAFGALSVLPMLPSLVSWLNNISNGSDTTGRNVTQLTSDLYAVAGGASTATDHLQGWVMELGAMAKTPFFNNAQGFKDLDSSLTNLAQANPAAAQEEYQRIVQTWEQMGLSAQTVRDRLPQFTAAVEQNKIATDAAWPSAQELAISLQQAGSSAQHAAQQQATATVAALGLGDGQSGLNMELLKSFTAYQQASSGAQAYSLMLKTATGSTMGLMSASDQFTIALGGLKSAEQQNGASLDSNTVKGAQNREAFLQAANAAQQHATAVYNSEVSTKGSRQALIDANNTLEADRQRFIDAANAAGYNKSQVLALANQLYALPKDLQIKIEVQQIGTNIGQMLYSMSTSRGGIGYAAGGVVGAASGGPRSDLTMVGEYGPELVNLPGGSTVFSNADSMGMLGGWGGGPLQIQLGWEPGAGGDALLTAIRKMIRVRAGTGANSVQMALGG